MLHFTPLGSGHTIGASAHLVEGSNWRILVDTGLHPGQGRRPDFERLLRSTAGIGLQDIQAVIITHAHLDHIGGLAGLLHDAPLPVFWHAHTGAIAALLFQRMPQLFAGIAQPVLARERLAQAIAFNAARDYHQPVAIPLPDGRALRLTLLPAGHIPGSACLHLETPDGTLLLTGDFNHRPSFFLEGTSQIPRYEQLKPDALIMEATYAGRAALSGPGLLEPARFAEVVLATIARGGAVLVPAFALGRAQELLALLGQKLLAEGHDLPPVWFDANISCFNRLFCQLFPDKARFLEPFLVAESAFAPSPPLAFPGLVMLSVGLIGHDQGLIQHLRTLLSDPRNALILSGRQLPGSFGQALEAAALRTPRPEGFQLNGGYVRIRSDIFTVPLSGHADHDGLLELVRRVEPARLVLIHSHGSPEALLRFQAALPPLPLQTPRDGQKIPLT